LAYVTDNSSFRDGYGPDEESVALIFSAKFSLALRQAVLSLLTDQELTADSHWLVTTVKD
jgi:hypothetical protein